MVEKDVRNKGEPDTDMGVSDNSFTVVKDLVSEQSPASGYLKTGHSLNWRSCASRKGRLKS